MYGGGDLRKAIAGPSVTGAARLAYEKNLFPRSAAEANRLLVILFGDDAPGSLLHFFTEARPLPGKKRLLATGEE